MATCSYQDLLDASACWTGYPQYEQEVMFTQMLCNLLDKIQNSGEVTCVPQELLDQAECFQGRPIYILKAIQLQLLCEISTAL